MSKEQSAQKNRAGGNPPLRDMAKFDAEIQHRRSIRLPGYDYSAAGAYYVTIVTQGRECLFGEAVKGEVHLPFH